MKQSKTFASGFPVEDTIESLRQQLAEMRESYDTQATEMKEAWARNAGLLEQLAASQAREMRLREALIGLYRLDEIEHQRYSGDGDVCSEVQLAREAIAIPADTTALEAMLAKAGEVMRERCRKVAFDMAYADSMAVDVSQTIRAIPAVTIDDLKGGA